MNGSFQWMELRSTKRFASSCNQEMTIYNVMVWGAWRIRNTPYNNFNHRRSYIWIWSCPFYFSPNIKTASYLEWKTITVLSWTLPYPLFLLKILRYTTRIIFLKLTSDSHITLVQKSIDALVSRKNIQLFCLEFKTLPQPHPVSESNLPPTLLLPILICEPLF